jgi:carbamate kinase
MLFLEKRFYIVDNISFMKKMVIALGGNALTTTKDFSYDEQQYQIKKTARIISNLIKKRYKIIITHGNGPQVGSILLQNEAFPKTQMPLDVCGAESQAQIGYMLQQAIANKTTKKVCTIVTQVLVDSKDTAFQNPHKPIGPYYSKKDAMKFKRKYKLKYIEGKGYRRIVPSPKPIDIIELPQIKKLFEDSIVVCSGGGGIPIIKTKGLLKGVHAVIDKDASAAALAKKIGADILMILTNVDAVCLNYKQKTQTKLKRLNIANAKKYLEAGQFTEGSMKPKVRAAIDFGGKTIITSINKAELALAGKAGTVIQ